MNKRNFFGLLAIFAIVVIAAINLNVNSSKIRGLSALSKANVEVLAREENGQGIYEEQRKRDKGRVNIMINGKLENCREIEVTCHGNGTLECLEHFEYDNCEPLYN